MTSEEHTIDNYPDTGLLSRDNIKAYLLTIIGIAVIIALYYILTGLPSTMQHPSGPPRESLQGGPGQPPPGGGTNIGELNTWPLWGQLFFPSLIELAIAIAIIAVFGLMITYVYKRKGVRTSIYLIVIAGVLLIIATNLIHGIEMGITQTMGAGQIFTDAMGVNNIFDFISNYDIIQPTLTTHATTQPPGATLTIYLLYLVFNTPMLVAIGLCVVAAVGSAFFLRGIVRQLFDDEQARYATFLYLLLPAVQVYYLANIYAIVATLVLAVLYFYFHEDRRVATVGSIISLFLLTFVSFLSIFMVFFLFIYEMLKANSIETDNTVDRLKNIVMATKVPILFSLCVGAVYGLLLVTLGFNYINAFLYASSLENPNGFMLFSSPVEYFASRIQNILDIAIFFGPVLSVLAYRGFITLREESTENQNSSKKYHIVLAALIALGLLFLTGAPKKGETARICMFILPFLLIPVIAYIRNTNMTRRDKIILLVVVFGQAVLLQLVGIWVW